MERKWKKWLIVAATVAVPAAEALAVIGVPVARIAAPLARLLGAAAAGLAAAEAQDADRPSGS